MADSRVTSITKVVSRVGRETMDLVVESMDSVEAADSRAAVVSRAVSAVDLTALVAAGSRAVLVVVDLMALAAVDSRAVVLVAADSRVAVLVVVDSRVAVLVVADSKVAVLVVADLMALAAVGTSCSSRHLTPTSAV